jgi:GAF domain-containing protein
VEAAPVLVGDVRLFEDHIACSSLSRSELVLPLWYGKETVGVLDMDSIEPDYFNTDDIVALQPLLDKLQSCWEGI